MDKYRVDLLLSCGHVQIIDIESIIKIPQIGESQYCSRCRADFSIQEVGMPWHEEDEITAEAINEN